MRETPPKTGTPRAPRVRLDVTADVIRDSKTRDSSHCMVAEAVRIAYPDAQNVAVDIQTIRFSDFKKGFRYVYLTPRVAQEAIIRFDQGDTPEPFRLQLRHGQVALAGHRVASRHLSEKEQAERKAAREALLKARLIDANPLVAAAPAPADPDAAPGEETVKDWGSPQRIGGKTPPIHTGLRREFGLRAFGRTR